MWCWSASIKCASKLERIGAHWRTHTQLLCWLVVAVYAYVFCACTYKLSGRSCGNCGQPCDRHQQLAISWTYNEFILSAYHISNALTRICSGDMGWEQRVSQMKRLDRKRRYLHLCLNWIIFLRIHRVSDWSRLMEQPHHDVGIFY